MIDSHCHLEQKDFDADLEMVIGRCKAIGMEGVVSVCAAPRDFEKTLQIAKRFPDFVFPSAGIHPEYIKEISSEEIDNFFEKLKKHSNEIFGIGEVGLDYFRIREPELREKQKELFVRFIEFSKQMKKPLVVHSR